MRILVILMQKGVRDYTGDFRSIPSSISAVNKPEIGFLLTQRQGNLDGEQLRNPH